ncbi:MAG: DUF4149 domain-containing protein [Rubrivivax sp.]|nr:DUF4149 domain-containing protein [Rubrivivax sp.]
MRLQRWRGLLPGLWAGWLLCVALLATPAPFALLPQADAGRVVGRMLAQEAYVSLALGIVLLVLERLVARRAAAAGQGTQFSTGMVLALGAVFCTIAGYFALQPLMAAARAGQGALSFGQLHAVSTAFYVVKVALVAALAWRAAGAGINRRPSS